MASNFSFSFSFRYEKYEPEKYFRVHRIKHVVVCSIHFVIVLTLCVGVFYLAVAFLRLFDEKKMLYIQNFFRQNENPIYFYEHILNPFSLRNHCFYVFSFIFLLFFYAAHIPFHSIDGGSFNSKPIFVPFQAKACRFVYANSQLQLATVCVGLCIVLADENTFRFTTPDSNSRNGKKKFYFFPLIEGRKSVESHYNEHNNKRNKYTISRCRHQFTSMWHCDITPPNIYYVKLSPTTMRPVSSAPENTPSPDCTRRCLRTICLCFIVWSGCSRIYTFTIK